ncbi:MAG TPA: site-2 protease family protein, partial [Polyangia bacterium]|nr:site-2 protease family protein [Polyangia bacterium]
MALIVSTPLHILLAIIALGLLIIVHEGGHFLIARLSGMRVDRFSIGFGPKLVSFKRGDTIYQIAAI